MHLSASGSEERGEGEGVGAYAVSLRLDTQWYINLAAGRQPYWRLGCDNRCICVHLCAWARSVRKGSHLSLPIRSVPIPASPCLQIWGFKLLVYESLGYSICVSGLKLADRTCTNACKLWNYHLVWHIYIYTYISIYIYLYIYIRYESMGNVIIFFFRD